MMMSRTTRTALAATGTMLLMITIYLMLVAGATAGTGIMSRVSTDANGVQGNAASAAIDISDDGRYVLIQSDATNLVTGDTNTSSDVFVKDTATGAIERVSVDSSGTQGNGHSYGGAISGDGRYVTFMSEATNLVAGDLNTARDVFVRDTQTDTTTRVSVSTAGVEGNSGSGFYPSDISADGRYVVFESDANNLVASDTNSSWDIFMRDTVSNTTTRVSTKSAGGQSTNGGLAPGIAPDGGFVAFSAGDGDLVTGDTNSVTDVFLKDIGTGGVTRVSTDSAGAQADDYSAGATVAEGGRYVAFESGATNLLGAGGDTNGVRDIYLKDTVSNVTTRLSTSSAGGQGNGACYFPTFTADSRYIAFSSAANNLVTGDGNAADDIFVKDRNTGHIIRVSVDPAGNEGNGASTASSISADGRFVAIHSGASNLVTGDTNSVNDAFLTPIGRHYFFTWYDDFYAADWVLAANPDGTGSSRWINLSIAGVERNIGSIPGYAAGELPSPGIMTPRYTDLIGGPVDLGSLTGDEMISSRRTLWGASSFEEVVGMGQERLSDHYYWTWYDQQSAGYQNWVLLNNPNTDAVYYEISIDGHIRDSDYLDPGDSVTPAFPTIMGGPVEAQAWTDNTKAQAAKIVASQRVLSNYGVSFNEVMGTPAEELTNQYIWTWYDNQSAGAQNWVLVSNTNAFDIYYEIKIYGLVRDFGTLTTGQTKTPTFAGLKAGPVEVQAWTDSGKTVDADILASQRVVWGPSFTETQGFPTASLASNYHWSWYDQQSAGAKNWVLIFNPNGTQVYYEVLIDGIMVKNGTIVDGQSVTPTIPGAMGGPVEVRAWLTNAKVSPRNVFASQRVLWNGYFNEVPGTVMN